MRKIAVKESIDDNGTRKDCRGGVVESHKRGRWPRRHRRANAVVAHVGSHIERILLILWSDGRGGIMASKREKEP